MNPITTDVTASLRSVTELIGNATLAAADGKIDRAELPAILVWASQAHADIDHLVRTARLQAGLSAYPMGNPEHLEETLRRTFDRLDQSTGHEG